MILALALLAALPADPPAAHDLLLEVGDQPAVRVRLTVEVGGKPLAKLDADARIARAALKGKPGAAALDRLAPDGSLLRAEAITPPSPHVAAVSNAILRALDADGDGKLSPAEIANAEKVLLAKFDHDDDECVTPLELVPDLQTVVPAARPTDRPIRVRVVPVEGKADIEKTVQLGGAAYQSVKVGKLTVAFHTRPGLPAELPAVPKSLLAEDRAEVKAAFEQAAAGVVSVTAVGSPVGLFDLLDADRDGQISVAELRAAKAALAEWSPDPSTVSLVIGPGVAGPPTVPLHRTFLRRAGPEWFRASDRNGDGYVSAREFLGTPEQFRQLDRNSDGLISPGEAERAGKP